jgi:hypothetical protein
MQRSIKGKKFQIQPETYKIKSAKTPKEREKFPRWWFPWLFGATHPKRSDEMKDAEYKRKEVPDPAGSV